MKKLLIIALLVIVQPVYSFENLLSNPTSLTYTFQLEKNIKEHTFKMHNQITIIELKFHPELLINNFEAEMAFSVWYVEPKYNEMWRTGVDIQFDKVTDFDIGVPENSFTDNTNQKIEMNGKCFVFTRCDQKYFTAKFLIPFVRKSHHVKWPYEIRLENVRYYFKNQPKLSLALNGIFEYNSESGFWKSIGLYARKKNLEVKLMTDTLSLSWGNEFNF